MQQLKIALIPMVRSTYDVQEGKKVFEREMSFLGKIQGVQWLTPPNVVEYLETITNFLHLIHKETVDGIVLMSATFHLGDTALAISSAFENTPILCWAVPEPPYQGSRVRLNSLVGAHLDFSNLRKTGRKDLNFIYGSSQDEGFVRKFNKWLNVLRVLKGWRGARIGLIGGHAKSFLDVDVDEPELFREFKIVVEHLPFETVFNYNPSEDDIQKLKDEYKSIYQYDPHMDDERLQKVARLALTFRNISQTTKSSALAVRCWPEFASQYGVSPCAAMSYDMANGLIISCEGDVMGAVAMLAMKSLGYEEFYLSDISQIFENENALLFWHCGVASHRLWDGVSRRTLDTYFAGGKGVTVGFVMKPGLVTIARIDFIEGWSLFLARGEAISTKQDLKGTYVKVKVEDAIGLVDTLIKEGFAHHVVMTYGDCYDELLELAKMKGWKVYAQD